MKKILLLLLLVSQHSYAVINPNKAELVQQNNAFNNVKADLVGMKAQQQQTLTILNKLNQQIIQQDNIISELEKQQHNKLQQQDKLLAELKHQQAITDERLKYQDLRKELLDRQENSIDKWLTVVGLFLTVFALLVPVGAWLFNRRVNKHIDDIRQLKEQAQSHVDEISGLKELTAEGVSNDPEHAEAIISEAKKSGTRLEKQIAKAYQVQRNGNIKQAINIWHRILGVAQYIDDGNLEEMCYVNLSHLLYKDKEFDQALKMLQQTIALNPKNDKAYQNMGVLYDELEQHPKAFEAYQHAIALNPKNAEAHYNMGITYSKLNQFSEAIEAYQGAIGVNPEYSYAYIRLLELCLITEEKYPPELVEQFKRKCADNREAMMILTMLEVFKNMDANNEELTAAQRDDFKQKYQGIGFSDWGLQNIEQWINEKENKAAFLDALTLFKNFKI
ncbi:MAG: hypothetical protein COA83_03010 [Methylophaga sp.]|nr:MAG: hypothetical protein COA83_03010 [Methylophaga sp.]